MTNDSAADIGARKMADRAVFMDRDNTIIEDPGYLSDPDAVKLLPGVELAMKSLAQAGYKLVVVTNQSGVARGLLTEEALDNIHTEMRRKLAEKNVHVDAIYYCPYHPEGTVEEYAKDSELRKPQPGMLLKAAGKLGLNLAASWMVGDSGRDVEAGQRAGCRTVRIRTRPSRTTGETGDENAQADFNVRNLVDAARLILREASRGLDEKEPERRAAPAKSKEQRPVSSVVGERRQEKVSPAGVAAIAAQVLAPLALAAALWSILVRAQSSQATFWALAALTLQVMALTFFVTRRNR